MVLYSFNKNGFEAEYWCREIAAASTSSIRFIPFNHGAFLDPGRYCRAQLLDNLYFQNHSGLLSLYSAVKGALRETAANVLLVDNCPPYHPEFLRGLDVFKVLRTGDGPLSAYDRDFAYVHAYDHVLFHSFAYSRDMTMPEKLKYVGARQSSFWPNALFDAMFDPQLTIDQIYQQRRDVDLVFIGALFPNKMALLASVKRKFGRRFRLMGLTTLKKNVYFNVRHGFPGWVRPARFSEYVPLYQRAKIGLNIHNRGMYTVGSYRLFDLPGNGVMQISDGGKYLDPLFTAPREIIRYEREDELLAQIDACLSNDPLRRSVAAEGFARVMREHRIRDRLHSLVEVFAPAVSA